MLRKALLYLMLVSALLFPRPVEAAQSYSADRFDVEVTVQPDGSVQVTETILFRFSGDPFTYVFRELATEFSDAITDIEVYMDGERLPNGTEPGQVEIERGDPLRVTWHFEPTTDSTHTFTLNYRMEGVVRQGGEADLLAWECLPTEREYAIASSTCRIDYPEQISLVAPPEIREGRADVSMVDSAAVFSAADVAPDETLIVALRFPPGSVAPYPPEWQQQQQQIRESRPYFIGAAVGVLVLGLGAIILYRMRYRRTSTAPKSYTPANRPPAERAPAVAGVLYQEGSYTDSGSLLLATLFDLARRGAVTIEEIEPESRWRKKDFVLRRGVSPTDAHLQPHERGLIQALFHDKKRGLGLNVSEGPRDSVRLSEMESHMYARVNDFTETLKDEIEQRGFISTHQRRGRHTLIYGGIILMVIALAAIFAIIFTVEEQFGPWPLLINASVFINGIVALILGATLSPLTEERLAEAQAWQRFARYLKDITRGRELRFDRGTFESYLPYAAAFGMTTKWVKHFEKEGTFAIPDWFHPLSTTGDSSVAAFVVMMAAISSSTSSAGAAGAGGAAGAAGGGASGAG